MSYQKKGGRGHARPLVYRLRTKNVRFVAPMPEQVGTPTMHLPDVPGDTCQKFTSQKLGEMDKIDAFQNPMLPQWGKCNPKMMFFRIPCTINREKISPNFGDVNF